MKFPKFSKFSKLTPDNSHEYECGSGDFAPDVAVNGLTESEDAEITKIIAKSQKESVFSWMPNLPKFPGVSRFSKLTAENSHKYERGSGEYESDLNGYTLTDADAEATRKFVRNRRIFNESPLGVCVTGAALTAIFGGLTLKAHLEVKNRGQAADPAEVSSSELYDLDSSDAVATINNRATSLLNEIEARRARAINMTIDAVNDAILVAFESLPEPEPVTVQAPTPRPRREVRVEAETAQRVYETEPTEKPIVVAGDSNPEPEAAEINEHEIENEEAGVNQIAETQADRRVRSIISEGTIVVNDNGERIGIFNEDQTGRISTAIHNINSEPHYRIESSDGRVSFVPVSQVEILN
jgi:hypothetical protein